MFEFDLPKDATRIWDLYVPYVKSDNQLDVYLQTGIDDPSCYSEICYILSTLDDKYVVNFHINTPGGVLDSAFQLVDAIKSCKATTIARLTGTVASAGTIIALACDEVIVADHTTFMIHNYSSSGGHGKGHELKAMQEFVDKSLNASFRVFYKDFLTEKEIENVIDGKDLWMDKHEVDARLKGTFHKANSETGEIISTTKRGRKKSG